MKLQLGLSTEVTAFRTWEDQHGDYGPQGIKHMVIVGSWIHLECCGESLMMHQRWEVTDDIPTCLHCWAARLSPD